jgi:hypothetical protein
MYAVCPGCQTRNGVGRRQDKVLCRHCGLVYFCDKETWRRSQPLKVINYHKSHIWLFAVTLAIVATTIITITIVSWLRDSEDKRIARELAHKENQAAADRRAAQETEQARQRAREYEIQLARLRTAQASEEARRINAQRQADEAKHRQLMDQIAARQSPNNPKVTLLKEQQTEQDHKAIANYLKLHSIKFTNPNWYPELRAELDHTEGRLYRMQANHRISHEGPTGIEYTTTVIDYYFFVVGGIVVKFQRTHDGGYKKVTICRILDNYVGD